MHVVFVYLFNSTWIKYTKEGNYVGWPMLTERNVARYYPETNETPKGHLNQSRRNFRSTKPKRTPLEVPNISTLKGRKVHRVYTSVYKVRNTVLYDQKGQSPTRSKTRKQIHIGHSQNTQQHNTGRPHQESQRCRAHEILSNNDTKIATSRNKSQEAHLGK